MSTCEAREVRSARRVHRLYRLALEPAAGHFVGRLEQRLSILDRGRRLLSPCVQPDEQLARRVAVSVERGRAEERHRAQLAHELVVEIVIWSHRAACKEQLGASHQAMRAHDAKLGALVGSLEVLGTPLERVPP
jgi:hypothetical protein